jgi:competence ComEA-like helix-hairpin-helix protein
MSSRSIIVALILVAPLAAAVYPEAAYGATLVNINTADLSTLETLSGIGPSKGQAIIDYRTQHGPFATIADIQNVSGIGPATYAGIKDYIMVSDPAPAQAQAQNQAQSTTTAADVQTQSSSVGSYAPPPVTARITTDATAEAGAGTIFDGAAFGTQGAPLAGVRYVWNFGDGGVGEGARVVHTYAYPGTYDVQLSIAYNYSSATARLALPVVEPRVSFVAEGDGSLAVYNLGSGDLDVGFWSLREGTSTFAIPESTVILAGKGVRFAPAVLGFSGDQSAALDYPNGALAMRARVGPNSPLRGETIEAPPKQARSGYGDSVATESPEVLAPSRSQPPSQASSSAPPQSEAAVLPPNSANQAAAADAPLGVEWSYLVGLVAVIAIGAVGSYYAYIPRPGAATQDPADEFDIE